MRTIETTATIAPDGTLTATVPLDIAPGEHHAVLVIDDRPVVPDTERPPLDLMVLDLGPWPSSLSLRREDMYDEWGR